MSHLKGRLPYRAHFLGGDGSLLPLLASVSSFQAMNSAGKLLHQSFKELYIGSSKMIYFAMVESKIAIIVPLEDDGHNQQRARRRIGWPRNGYAWGRIVDISNYDGLVLPRHLS